MLREVLVQLLPFPHSLPFYWPCDFLLVLVLPFSSLRPNVLQLGLAGAAHIPLLAFLSRWSILYHVAVAVP